MKNPQLMWGSVYRFRAKGKLWITSDVDDFSKKFISEVLTKLAEILGTSGLHLETGVAKTGRHDSLVFHKRKYQNETLRPLSPKLLRYLSTAK